MYVFMYVCMYVYVCVCLCMYVCMKECIRICMCQVVTARTFVLGQFLAFERCECICTHGYDIKQGMSMVNGSPYVYVCVCIYVCVYVFFCL
jgi:hypothetical protein